MCYNILYFNFIYFVVKNLNYDFLLSTLYILYIIINNETPFIVACKNNRIEIVKLLLSYKSLKSNNKTRYGTTAFTFACMNGHTDLVKLLIDSNIDVNEKNNNAQTPFLLMCARGQINMAKLIIKSEKFNSSIACKYGRIDIVRLLLQIDGFDSLNTVDIDGNTPFILTCENGCTKLARRLLNVNVLWLNEKNNKGYTGFKIAFNWSRVKIVKMLLLQPSIEFYDLS